LADFKVPKVIRIVSSIPKNATGKVDERRELAARFSQKS
jgi:non-ribosomal peptide synthetase component E (peptide arylation enzyme)